MAEYSFDGKDLRNSAGKKLGEIDRSYIRSCNAALLGELDRKNIRDPRGKKILEFDGKTVKDDRGKKIATIGEISALIDGDPGIDMVAAWYFFIKTQTAFMA